MNGSAFANLDIFEKRNSPKALSSINLLCEKKNPRFQRKTHMAPQCSPKLLQQSHHQYPETGGTLFGVIAVPGSRGATATFGIQNYTYSIPFSVCLAPLVLDLAMPPYIVKARSIISTSLAHDVSIQYKVTQPYNLADFPQKWHAVVSTQLPLLVRP